MFPEPGPCMEPPRFTSRSATRAQVATAVPGRKPPLPPRHGVLDVRRTGQPSDSPMGSARYHLHMLRLPLAMSAISMLAACSPIEPLTAVDEALTWRAPLPAGQFESPPFRPQFAGRKYWVDLVASRSMPPGYLECALGVAIQETTCGQRQPTLNIKWEIRRGDVVVAEGIETGRARGASFGSEIARRMGGFVAEPGAEYRIHLWSKSDLQALTDAQLRISVYGCRNLLNKSIECFH